MTKYDQLLIDYVKQKEINKNYVDECEDLKKQIIELENENMELDSEYGALVNFLTLKYPKIACEYLELKLKKLGATIYEYNPKSTD